MNRLCGLSGFFSANRESGCKVLKKINKKLGSLIASLGVKSFLITLFLPVSALPSLLIPLCAKGMRSQIARLVSVSLFAGLLTAEPLMAEGRIEAFLHAADNGLCIEDVVYREVHKAPAAQAAGLVEAAMQALGRRESEQRQLGCAGDIATQAIAAGADPQVVLKATAAGL
jgi:hypothetical protein